MGQLTWRSIRARYQASLLGFLWAFITPMMLLVIYTFVFSVIFHAQWGNGVADSKVAFSVVLLCGLTIYTIFSETVNLSARIIAENPNYVKKVVFPLEMLPLSTHLTSVFYSFIWFGIAIIGTALMMHRVCVTMICLPLVLAPLMLFACGVGWFVASLGVYFRDLSHLITILLQMLFYLTPIFYAIDRVPLPFRYFYYLNPLTFLVQETRNILVFNVWPDWRILGGLFIISLAVAQLGFVWFVKTKKGFADVV